MSYVPAFFTQFSENTIKKIASVLKYIYLFGFVIGALGMIVFIPQKLVSPILIIFPVISVVQYYGLHKRKSWIVPTIVILTSIGLVRARFFSFPQTTDVVIARFLGVGFAAFEIYFFTRKEVRKCFNAKGIFIY